MGFGRQRGLITLLRHMFKPRLTGVVIFWGGFSLASAESDTWQYGLMLDFAYVESLTTNKTQQWRNKLTSNRLNQPAPNMGMAYLRKLQGDDSPLGMEFAVKTGN